MTHRRLVEAALSRPDCAILLANYWECWQHSLDGNVSSFVRHEATTAMVKWRAELEMKLSKLEDSTDSCFS